MTFKEIFENEAAVNAAGSGGVDGIGIGDRGEPPVNKRGGLFRRRSKNEPAS